MFVCGDTTKSIGSEYATAPGLIEIDGEPEKVRPLRVEVSIPETPAAPLRGRAIEAAVMGKSEPPKVLDSWMRIRDAPMEAWKV